MGTTVIASADQTQESCEIIRKWVQSNVSDEAAQAVRIVYGGSVRADNATELFAMPDIDGALVGGASLDAKEFLAICRA